MTPKEAFGIVDQILANHKLTLTPPEWMRFMQAMQILALSVQPPPSTESPNP